MTETDTTPDKTWPMVVYVLYLAGLVSGFVIISVTTVIGLIIAYVNSQHPDERISTHYWFLIRTFWIGALYSVLAAITMPIGIGWLILVWAVVWLIIRCVKGMVALNEGRAHPEPASWVFG